ncbi:MULTISPECIES: ATPase domain-containing protein [unclassified Treponema]|uniref:ATPase domain-containing protein n=1 Tax=unclassified Treponema TaxID=2638727 RepID=UPI0025D094CB|nr:MULTISPECIES: ATPase domain-containing protein [unclassified Treponema]
MVKQDLYNKSPVRLFDAATEGGLKEGGLGLVTSKKGLGKTSVLVQFGMDTLLKDEQLVHVTFDLHSSNVISWYDGIFAEIAKKSAGNSAELKTDVVSKRTILNFSLDNFSVTKVVNTLKALSAAGIAVKGVVMDGIDFTKVSEDDVKAVAGYAQSEKVTVWTSATSEGAKLADVVPANLEKYFDVVINLSQTGSNVAVDILKLGDKKDVESGLKLDSKTLLISK